MTKYPFTTAGFEDLQTALYALTDPELNVQAQLILMDFNDWMEANFDLSTSQITFLESINPETRLFTAFQTSYAVRNRLPVNLIKPLQRTEDPVDDDGKLIRPKSKLISTSDGNGNFSADGYLDIEILYEP